MNFNYGSFNQPPPREFRVETPPNSRAVQLPLPLNEPNSPASNKTRSLTRFQTFTYLFIGLVVGYIFNNFFNAASWTLEETIHDRARRIWRRDEAEHERTRSRMLEDKAAWENEKIIRDAERERWEQVEREGRAGIMWEHVYPSDKCLRYGTKEYTGVLTHVPFGFDAMQECMRKPALINGKERLPVRCEDSVSLVTLRFQVERLLTCYLRGPVERLSDTGKLITKSYARQAGDGYTIRCVLNDHQLGFFPQVCCFTIYLGMRWKPLRKTG